MANINSPIAHAASSLRTVISAITTTPEISGNLTLQVPALYTLLTSSPVLDTIASVASGVQRHKGFAEQDAKFLLHKYKTNVSSLLHSRDPQRRWEGIVLVGASVESSFEVLVSHGAIWTRLLVPFLGKPERAIHHFMTIQILTKIFTDLTASKPTLIREIVLPNLPMTVNHLLDLCYVVTGPGGVPDSENLPTILASLKSLLQAHPVTYRPFFKKTHDMIVAVLASYPSRDNEQICREIMVLLNLCASGASKRTPAFVPASGAMATVNKASAVPEEWFRNFRALIRETHTLLNSIFHSILEDHDGYQLSSGGSEVAPIGLGPTTWKGLSDGLEKNSILLRLLKSYVTLATASSVTIPLGQTLDLVSRILSVNARSLPNPAVERSERDLLLASLPEIHKGCLDLLLALTDRLNVFFAPFALGVLEKVVYVFSEGSWHKDIKKSCYNLVTNILSLFGSSLDARAAHSLHPLLSTVCDDLLPPPPIRGANNLRDEKKGKGGSGKKQNSAHTAHADSFIPGSTPTSNIASNCSSIRSAAEALLATAIAKIPTAFIRSELRTKLDRTVILTGNEKGMMASVLFPPVPVTKAGASGKSAGSILPHLVSSSSKFALEVEGLVRPRLPVIWTSGGGAGQCESEEEGREGEMIGGNEEETMGGNEETIRENEYSEGHRENEEEMIREDGDSEGYRSGSEKKRQLEKEGELERSPKRQCVNPSKDLPFVPEIGTESDDTKTTNTTTNTETLNTDHQQQVQETLDPMNDAPHNLPMGNEERVVPTKSSPLPLPTISSPQQSEDLATARTKWAQEWCSQNVDGSGDEEVPFINLEDSSDSE